MRKQASRNRAKPMSLANALLLSELASCDDKYVATLPFDPTTLTHYEAGMTPLEQTKKRWEWYSEAQNLDPKLGTFGYLPPEVRKKVLKYVVGNDDRDEAENGDKMLDRQQISGTVYQWQIQCRAHPNFHLGDDVFRLHACSNCFVENCLCLESSFPLRSASTQLRDEFDQVFLSQNIFKFTSPSRLHQFVEQLSPFQQAQLRRIILQPFTWRAYFQPSLEQENLEWRQICGELPTTLQSVLFVIFELGKRAQNLSYPWRGGGWGRGGRFAGYQDRAKIRDTPEVVDLLRTLKKQIERCAPKAYISIACCEFEEAEQKILRALFDEAS